MWQSHSKKLWGTASRADFLCAWKTRLSRAIDFQVSLRLGVLHISLAGQPVRKWIFWVWYKQSLRKTVLNSPSGVFFGAFPLYQPAQVWTQVLCGESKDDLDRKKLYLPLILHTLQACLQSSSRDVYRSGVLTPANLILCFIVLAFAETDWGTSAYSRSKTMHSRSKRDRHCLLLAKKARWQKASHMSAGTRRSSGNIYRQLTSSWRSLAAASRVHRTFNHSCWGVRVHAAGWDRGLSSGARVFLEWVNTEMTTKGWLGAEADARQKYESLYP